MASKVYFTDFCTGTSETLPQKLARLCLSAGMDKIDFKDKFVAIKIHFGELGNMAHLRAGYARVIVDLVKDLGGKPFLTDANTMYVGSRKNALDHLETAYLNGFTPYSTGCHILIADGLKGTDDVDVPVVGGEYVKTAKIGRAIMDADIVISLTHFKGHEEAGFCQVLRPRRPSDGEWEDAHRLDQVHGLRPLHRCVPGEGHPLRLCPVHFHPELQDRRVYQGSSGRTCPLPHQLGAGCESLLRLPSGK